MGNLKPFFYTVLACLAISTGARAQAYVWQITQPGIIPIPGSNVSLHYGFNRVDCYGEVCIAAGQVSGTAFTGNHLMFFRSTNGGLTWAAQDPDLPSVKGTDQDEIFRVQQIDSLDAVGVGYIADTLDGSTDDTGFVVRTYDGGLTWQRQDIHTSETVGGVHFSDSLTGIIILNRPTSGLDDACDIETTHDGGQTWTLAPFSPWNFGASCHSDGGNSFRVISYEFSPVYSTTDNWNTVDSTPYIIPLTDFTHILTQFNFKGEDTIIGYGASGSSYNDQSLFIDRSTDGGMTWDSVIYSGIAHNGLCMSSLDRDVVFLSVTVDDYPYLGESTDHGTTWNIVPMSLDTDVGLSTNSVAVTSQNEAIAAIGGDGLGVILRGSAAPAIVSPSVALDDGVQIYPDPASETLNITSAEAGSTIHLLDILGREVLHETVPASRLLTLDVSLLPTGLYYISDGITREKFVKE
jgi:hypothetical protein